MEARRGECSENNRILTEEALEAGLVEHGRIPREMAAKERDTLGHFTFHLQMHEHPFVKN